MTRSKPCPTCGGEMLFGKLDGKDGYACLKCWHSERVHGATVCVEPRPQYEDKLPHMDRGRQKRKLRWRETDTEECVRRGCALRGWTVLFTIRRRKRQRCPVCGQMVLPQGGDGCSKGLPDCFIRTPDMPPLTWIGIELKGSDTAVSPEQAALRDAGAIAVCPTWEEVESVIRRKEKD